MSKHVLPTAPSPTVTIFSGLTALVLAGICAFPPAGTAGANGDTAGAGVAGAAAGAAGAAGVAAGAAAGAAAAPASSATGRSHWEVRVTRFT